MNKNNISSLFNNVYDKFSDIMYHVDDSEYDDYSDCEYIKYTSPSYNIFISLYETIFCCRY